MSDRLTPGQDPETPAEWQDAVDVAEVLLMVESARQYGLITGGPVINVERCAALLKAGAARGVRPSPAGVDDAIRRVAEGTI